MVTLDFVLGQTATLEYHFFQHLTMHVKLRLL